MIERRSGISRWCFLIGPYAIKVPRLSNWASSAHNGRVGQGRLWSFTRGVQANLSELEWSQIPGVAPVLWSFAGGIVNVYPRAEACTTEPTAAEYAAIAPDMPMRGDCKPDNVGWIHGRLVWLDYDQSWNACPHHTGGFCRSFDDD